MNFHTTDLSDAYPTAVSHVAPMFRSFGQRKKFFGIIRTVKCFEDNSKVGSMLDHDGENSVLVVDGSASLRCALLGDLLAEKAARNRWLGLVINGCIRDLEKISKINIGVLALSIHPKKSLKQNTGQTDIPVEFASVHFQPQHWLYADEDGILVSKEKLLPLSKI